MWRNSFQIWWETVKKVVKGMRVPVGKCMSASGHSPCCIHCAKKIAARYTMKMNYDAFGTYLLHKGHTTAAALLPALRGLCIVWAKGIFSVSSEPVSSV